MTYQAVNIGTAPNDGTGDPARTAFTKVNQNFTELYAANTSLASSSGSSLVGFLQSGTGAVTRTVQAKERDIINVADFGAVGDGTTNDSAALLAAITAAGTNGSINLTAGKTYLVDRRIKLLSGQTLIGYGATIKRRAQIISTTTTSITSGSTNVITLASGGGALFSVGQSIDVYNGSNYGTQNVTISSIVGDVVTTASSFVLSAGSPFTGTTTVVLSFDTLATTDLSNIFGVTIDGNKSNWSYYHWEVTAEIGVGMTVGKTTIRDCIINNAAGEGILDHSDGSAIGNKYVNNVITNTNGNGIHLSGCVGTIVSNNYIYNTNIQGTAMGHDGGGICISALVSDYIISNNFVSTGRCGVGQIDQSDNSAFVIAGNTFRDMTAYMLEIRGFNAAIVDGLVANNRFYNTTAPAAAAMICVSIEDTNTLDIGRFVVSGNQFHNAGLIVSRTTNLSITGNSFEVDYQASDTYHSHIYFNSTVSNITVSGNSTRYGISGVAINTGTNSNINIIGNSIEKPYYYGVYDGTGGTAITISNNNINMDNNVNTGSASAILTFGPNTVIKNNNIKMTAGYCGIRVYGTANTMVQCNTVRGAAAGKTIRVETGSTGYVVGENQINYAVTDVPAVGVRVSNNDIIV
jgi:hypothetical protein